MLKRRILVMTAVTLVFIVFLVVLLDVDRPALDTAQSENDLTQAPTGDKQNSTNRREPYTRLREAQFELEWIQELLQDPEKLVSVAELESVNMTKVQLLEELGLREAEFERTVKQLASAAPEYQDSSTDESAQRPFQIQTDVPLEFNNEKLRALAEAQQMPGCALSFGQVRANDFFEYRQWDRPTRSEGDAAFWPLQESEQIQQQTFTGNWTGSTGAYFWQTLEVPRGLPWESDSIITAAVLQFSIPAPTCDSVLYWGTRAVVDAPTNWNVVSIPPLPGMRSSRIWIDVIIQENTQGGPFPFTKDDFPQFYFALRQDDSGGPTVKRDVTSINRSFEVAAGDSPNIYLGISIWSASVYGIASTIRSVEPGDNFEFGNGITYVMVPN